MRKNKPFNPLPAELRKLGLNEKEAEIYLSLLEKRADTVLNISKETSLSRPTVYRALQSLIVKELIFKDKHKRRSLYAVNSPDSFLNILKIQRKKAEEQEREFLRIISTLQGKYYSLSKKNKIGIYQTKTALEDFSNTNERNIRVLCFGQDEIICKKISRFYQKINKRLGSISVKEISNKKTLAYSFDFVQNKILAFSLNKKSGILIITDKAFLINKKQAISIKEESTVDFLKIIFDLLWSIKN